MKKLLFLGGAMQQIPAIIKAKEMGCYVITCDYTPNNPGHKYADEYYNISTTDIELVYKLAEEKKVDGVVAYASDPAAVTAAYVSEKLKLCTSPFKSVEILSRKDKFREFLKQHNFHTPKAKGYTKIDDAVAEFDMFCAPVMIKPVDSSGSKGVVKVYDKIKLKTAIEEALSYSRCGMFIMEEFIEKKGYQISGDGFSVEGKLVFTSYGNELYNENCERDYVAMGEFWPCLHDKELLSKVDSELQRLVTELHMQTTAYNIEVIIDKKDDIYILEFAPRNGGSYIPQLIQYATGVDLVEYTIRAALGDVCNDFVPQLTCGVWSNYMIFSKSSGYFEKIWFEENFKKNNLIEVYCSCEHGQWIEAYKNTTNSLGTIIFNAKTIEEMQEITENIEKYMKVVVRDGKTSHNRGW